METSTEFDEIFRLYYSQLFAYALQMINNQEECHDIVSSAYEYVWNNFKRIKKESAKTYLYITVKSKCINYLRRQNRHEEYIEFYKKLGDITNEEDEKHIEYHNQIEHINHVLNKLTPHTRKILEACYIERKKYNEVATEFNISTNTVKKHITKAMQLLREEMLKKD